MFTLRLLGSASLDGPDGPVTGRAALRQRIALLALLAVEHPRPLTRDRLVAFLWPESGGAEARHLLRESLYILRSALGEDSVLSAGDDLRLNPDRLHCDLWEFEASLATDELEQAVGLCHGSFLSGFHLSGAEEFEKWADSERSRLNRRYTQALEQLAERAMRDANPVRAIEWWSRLTKHDPYSSRTTLRHMQALEAAGDRAGALRLAMTHSELLRTDLDAAPEQEVIALAERLRLESRPASVAMPMKAAPAAISVSSEGNGEEQSASFPGAVRPTPRSWVVATVLIIGVVLGLGVFGGMFSRPLPKTLSPQRVVATPFENHTGRRDLDDLGALAADWMVRGVIETPLVEMTDLAAVYARGAGESVRPRDPIGLAEQEGAGLVIRGSYFLSGDSVLFQTGIVDVASGRVLRSFDPVGAPLDRAVGALERLREQIAGGLSPFVSPFNPADPVDPELIPPPSLAAYREFVGGLKSRTLGDWTAESDHFRKAATLDSTFVAPLIQLAVAALWHDQCSITDSVGIVLENRRDQLTEWNRLTVDLLRASCRGDRAKHVRLLQDRHKAYPGSLIARGTYAVQGLLCSNRPRAARKALSPLQPDEKNESWYWWHMAAISHVLRGYDAELGITDRWLDSAEAEWQVVRGRALAALGREREVMDLLGSMGGVSVDSVAAQQLTIATEFAVHGYPKPAMAIAESVLARLEAGLDIPVNRAANIALANRLLGRREGERQALARIARSSPDTLERWEAEGRIAVLLADTVQSRKVDSALAEESSRPLRNPWIRGSQLVARAHIAAGFGRREQAVALLQEASARGMVRLGPSHAFHNDLLLTPLHGYPPFDALLKPDN